MADVARPGSSPGMVDGGGYKLNPGTQEFKAKGSRARSTPKQKAEESCSSAIRDGSGCMRLLGPTEGGSGVFEPSNDSLRPFLASGG